MRIEQAEKLRMNAEIIAAEEEVRKIIRTLKYRMDPLMRNVFELEGENAIEFEELVKRRAENQPYIDKLHEGSDSSMFSKS